MKRFSFHQIFVLILLLVSATFACESDDKDPIIGGYPITKEQCEKFMEHQYFTLNQQVMSGLFMLSFYIDDVRETNGLDRRVNKRLNEIINNNGRFWEESWRTWTGNKHDIRKALKYIKEELIELQKTKVSVIPAEKLELFKFK